MKATSIKIVLNYRRDDASGHAGRLYDALSKRFGDDNVFIDIDAIQPGTDFVEAIDVAVGSCDAFLAVIGRRWLTATDAEGRRRLDDPDDFVRLEIESALRSDVLVIPVLVQEAEMPGSSELPEPLLDFGRIQATEASDGRWQYDVGRLIAILDNVERDKRRLPPIPPPPEQAAPRERPRPRRPRLPWLAGAGVAAVALAVLLFVLLGAGGQTASSGTAGKIAYSYRGSIFSVGPGGGGTPTLLTKGDAHAPDWSPDGKRIAFSRAGDIWVMKADGTGTEERLTDTPASDSSPSWSPDGTQLVFDRSDPTGPTSVWKMDADGSRATRLARGAAPDWSASGDGIAFQRDHNIDVMSAGGILLHSVTARIKGTGISAAWSPDGRTIAYVRIVGVRGRPACYLSLISPDGTGNTSHTRAVRIPRNYPAWSPDGKHIAFTAPDGLWVVDRDGGGLRQIARGTGMESPSWTAHAL